MLSATRVEQAMRPINCKPLGLSRARQAARHAAGPCISQEPPEEAACESGTEHAAKNLLAGFQTLRNMSCRHALVRRRSDSQRHGHGKPSKCYRLRDRCIRALLKFRRRCKNGIQMRTVAFQGAVSRGQGRPMVEAR